MKNITSEDLDRLLQSPPPTPKTDKIISQCRDAIEACDLDKAQFLAFQVLLVSPHSCEGYLLLCEIYGRCGRFETVIGTAKRAIEIEPGNGTVYCKLAEAYRCLGDVDGAIAALETATNHIPNDPDLYLRLGRLAKQSGRRDVAVAAFARTLELEEFAEDRATEALTSLIKVDSALASYLAPTVAKRFETSITLQTIAAESYLVRKRPGRCLGELGEKGAGCSGSPFAAKVRGQALLDLAHPRAAQACVEDTLNAGLMDAQLERLGGVAARYQGRTRRALEYYEKALAKGAQDARLLLGRAVVLEHEGFLQESLRIYRQVADAKPDDPEPYANIARLQNRLGDTGAAEEALVMAQRRYGAALQLLDVPVRLAGDDESLSDPEDWANVLRRGILTDGERIAALYAFAQSAHRAGRTADATAAWEEANRRYRQRIDFDFPAFARWFDQFITWQSAAFPTGLGIETTAFRCRPIVLLGVPCDDVDRLAFTLNAYPNACHVPQKALDRIFEDALTLETTRDRDTLRSRVINFRAKLENQASRLEEPSFFVIESRLLNLGVVLLRALFPDALFVNLDQSSEETARDLYQQWRPTSEPWSNDIESCQLMVHKTLNKLRSELNKIPLESQVTLTKDSLKNRNSIFAFAIMKYVMRSEQKEQSDTSSDGVLRRLG